MNVAIEIRADHIRKPERIGGRLQFHIAKPRPHLPFHAARRFEEFKQQNDAILGHQLHGANRCFKPFSEEAVHGSVCALCFRAVNPAGVAIVHR